MKLFINTNTEHETPDGRYVKEKDIKHIKKLLNKVFEFNREKASLILAQQLYKEYINLDSATTLFKELNGNIDTLKKVYYEYETTTETIGEILVESGAKVEDASLIEEEIIGRIAVPRYFGSLSERIEDNIRLVIDPEKKEVIKDVVTFNRKGDENHNEIKLIDASLKELIVYDNPIAEETRQFKSVWLKSD